MRRVLLIAVVPLIVGTIGYLFCRVAGVNPHTTDLVSAALVAAVAGGAGVVPLRLRRGESLPVVAQAGLIGTVVQLVVSIVAAGAIVLSPRGLKAPFLIWLVALYWVNLIVLTVQNVRDIRQASVSNPTNHLT